MLQKLGKYELIEVVGRGAMGEVYKAQDPLIGRLVALKTITAGLSARADLLERFYQEARSAGALQHPNIVTVYELGKESDTPFIAMEFLEGESLERLIERRPVLTLAQKVSYIIPVCRALDYAHKRGVVHRDVKPGNVMIASEGGVVKVVDFGIARLMDSTHTQTNTVIGTLAYMSPEQIRGDRADARSDIWATGAMLYELLAYKRPFEGANQTALMMNIASPAVQPPPLATEAPDCTPALDAVVAKMLHKDLDQRYQSMEEVLFDFEPLWRQLQEASVAEMVAGVEELIRAKNFTRARDVLRRALQMDSSDSRAKTLLEEVNTQLRESVPPPDANTMLENARVLLKENRHEQAKKEVQAVLKLDPENTAAQELLAEIDRAANTARQGLVEILQKARDLWSNQQIEDCLALLTAAQKDFPADPELLRLLGIVTQERTEQRRRARLAEAKVLLENRQLDDALAATDSVAKEFPRDISARKLREAILREIDARKDVSTQVPAPAQQAQAEMPTARETAPAQPPPSPTPIDAATQIPFRQKSAPPSFTPPLIAPPAAPQKPALENNVPFAADERTVPVARAPRRERSIFVPLVVGTAVIAAGAFVAMHFRNTGPSARELTLQEQAQHEELVKDWPGALVSYKSLSQLNGPLAADASSQASRLQTLIDQENNFFEHAQSAASVGNFSLARDLYQRAADLHGDRQQEAVNSAAKLNAAGAVSTIEADPAPVPPPTPPAPKPKAVVSQPKPAKHNPAPPSRVAAEASVPAKPTSTANCQLMPSDIARYLDMADNNRGRGKYSDAERQYNSVLQCEPENERARSGLARARQAEAISSGPSNP